MERFVIPFFSTFFLFTAFLAGATSSQTNLSEVKNVIKQVESELSARVGVAVLDTQSGQSWNYKGNERFAMMSTFKSLLCANMFSDAEKSALSVDTVSIVREQDIVTYSPVTEKRIGKAMSMFDACEATMITSDNTAANIVLKAVGGPEGLTGFLREIGDTVTRLDRYETELNEAAPGDPRDTSTPIAMVNTLQGLLLGEKLTASSQQQLIQWMKDNKITGPLLRSVLPSGWEIADRSGSGQNGSRGITALVWPPQQVPKPQRAPILISIYLTEADADFKLRNKAIARIGEAIFNALNY